MRCQKPVSYMDRNMTRWGIQLLDICSVLTQKDPKPGALQAVLGGLGGRAGRLPPAGASRARRKFLPGQMERKLHTQRLHS